MGDVPEGYKETKIGVIPEDWEVKKLKDISDCKDNKRKPLNNSERSGIKGEIPYYGANGVVDYISEYIFNEPLILMAEDGGNFEEFNNKPIAYKISGKSWVNNHAHIITNKIGTDFDFLYYSLVHKDVRKYINGSTRSKLTKSDMLEIEMNIPPLKEQQKIAEILSTQDKEIDLLKQKLELVKTQKKGLMQNLLTGKVRVNV
jgi:type I restriction enzyme S subunit